MTEESNLTVEERCHVADDILNILTRALEVCPENGGVATAYATLYLRHPLRKQNEDYFLKKAVGWLELADKWSEGIENLAYEALSFPC